MAYKELKTSNFDLRSEKILSSIQKHGKVQVSYQILQGIGDEYFLDTRIAKKLERIKISNRDALQYDKYFVSKFIHLKYSLPSFKGKSCRKSFSLSMRGETQDICYEEKDKLVVMDQLVNKIKEIYKK